MSHSKTDLTNAIDEYVFGSQAREIMMRSMYDRQPYEGIAADLGISRDTVGRTVRHWRGRSGAPFAISKIVMEMSFSVFEKIDPSCQNGSMEKAKNLPYHQRPYASIAERTLVDISIYSPRPQIAGTGHSHSKISLHSPRAGRDRQRRSWHCQGQ